MANAAERRATFAELYAAILALPEGITGEILMDGQIETMARPGRAHTHCAGALHRKLGELEAPPWGWVFAWERELRLLEERLAVPDLAGWRVPDGDTAFLDPNPVLRVPDWCCEVLSASTAKKDRETKLPLYLAAGVGHVWLADPEARHVEVFVAGVAGPVCVAEASGGGVVTLAPFEGWGLELGALWVPPRG